MVPINGLDRASSFDFHYWENYVYFSVCPTVPQPCEIQRAVIMEETLRQEEFVANGIQKVIMKREHSFFFTRPHCLNQNAFILMQERMEHFLL